MTGNLQPFLVGLTGSIGMGKSTVAGFFADCGAEVWNADDAVHQLYQLGQDGAKAIEEIVPNTIVSSGVDRRLLSKAISDHPGLLKKIEAAIHPLVAKDRAAFIENCTTDIAVLDIPLLFETGDPDSFDLVVVVSADAAVQRKRVLDRPNMTEAKLDLILANQVPDHEKRNRADIVIPTDVALDVTREHVATLVRDIRKGKFDGT